MHLLIIDDHEIVRDGIKTLIVDLELTLTLNKALADKKTLLNRIDSLYQTMKKSLGSLRPSAYYQ